HTYPISLFTTPAPPDTYTLSLHDALPICLKRSQLSKITADPLTGQTTAVYQVEVQGVKNTTAIFTAYNNGIAVGLPVTTASSSGDRKSTRLNSSHVSISYAVFCLKKKNKI